MLTNYLRASAAVAPEMRREDLTRRYKDALEDNRWIGKIKNLYGPGGGESHALQMSYGQHRQLDHLIAADIINRLSQRGPKDPPLKILEIGGGVTFPSGRHFGAPWLARRLQSAFPNSLDLTVTDLNDTDTSTSLTLLFNSERPINLTHDIKGIPFSEIRRAYRGSVTLAPLKLNEEQAADLENVTREYGLDERWRKANSITVFARPMVDPDFEKALFNLKFVGGVDMHRPPAGILPESYDVVFARHLCPLLDPASDLRRLGASLARLVKPSGSYFAYCDKSGELIGGSATKDSSEELYRMLFK